MKVAVVMQDTRGLYGAEKATVELVRGLRHLGIDMETWLLEEERLAGGGESVLAKAFAAVGSVRRFGVKGRISRELARELRTTAETDGIEVLHSTGYKADVHVAMAAGEEARFAIVSTVHGWLFRRWAWKEQLFYHADLMALRRFDRVVVLSDFYERLLQRRGLLPTQLARIPSTVAVEEVSPGDARRELYADDVPFTFGMLGRLSEEKNHAMALRAARHLDRLTASCPRPWRLLVAGTGPLRDRLGALAKRLGVADRVEFAGRMEADAFFRRVHVLLQPSTIENRPMALLEAGAWGRPVIATAVGGMPEMVEDGVTGRLVTAHRWRGPLELAKAMRSYWVNPESARQQGETARRHLLEAPGPESVWQAYAEVFRTARKP